jgi:hypothetical protein
MNTATQTYYQSRLLKADRRGAILSSKHRNYSTFHFGAHRQAGSEPFGSLQFINDLAVAPGHTIFNLQNDEILDIILPVAGSVVYNGFENNSLAVNPEQVLFLNDGRNNVYSLNNEHTGAWSNYLSIGLKRNDVSVQKHSVQKIEFSHLNTLASLNIEKMAGGCYGYTGVYKGRTKANYTLKRPENGVFIYVIDGAFEVEDRLMEFRDGLALWDTPEIEFESLSDNAVLLLLEVPLDQIV